MFTRKNIKTRGHKRVLFSPSGKVLGTPNSSMDSTPSCDSWNNHLPDARLIPPVPGTAVSVKRMTSHVKQVPQQSNIDTNHLVVRSQPGD